MRIKTRDDRRQRIKYRIRKRVSGSEQRPRLTVFRSVGHMYVQVVDDMTGRTIASASTVEPAVKGALPKPASGGNVEGAKAGEVVDLDGIKIVGYTNVAGRVAQSASSLYARNLFNFIETMVDKANKTLAVNWDDELVKATALTKDGAVIHPNFQPKA